MSATPKPGIPNLPRSEWTDPAREVFSFWGEPDAWENGSKTNILMTLANHPPLGQAYNIWGKHLLISNTLPNYERELIILRIAWVLQSEYEWHYHVGYGLNYGMTLAQISDIRTFPEGGDWNEKDSAVLTSVDELMNTGDLSDASWATLQPYFDRKQIMDLIFMIGHYVMTSWALQAMRVSLEDGVDKIGFDLVTASGKTPRADNRPIED